MNRFQNPLSITREEVMSICGIGSKNTYHKCLRELHQFGYIFYRPSPDKFHRSSVNIVRLDQSNSVEDVSQLKLFSLQTEAKNEMDNSGASVSKVVQVEENNGIKSDTVSVPLLTAVGPTFDTVPVPYLGLIIHKLNYKQEREENSLTQKIFSKNKNLQKAINNFSAAPKIVPFGPRQNDRQNHDASEKFQQPLLDQVISFFETNQYPLTEGHKFFNHYNSNGWQVGGKAPMHNWQSSAHKWMLNTGNFISVQNVRNGQQEDFDTGTGKNYSQPL